MIFIHAPRTFTHDVTQKIAVFLATVFCLSSYIRIWTETLLTLFNQHQLWRWFLCMLDFTQKIVCYFFSDYIPSIELYPKMNWTLCDHHGLWRWFLYMLLWPSHIQFQAKNCSLFFRDRIMSDELNPNINRNPSNSVQAPRIVTMIFVHALRTFTLYFTQKIVCYFSATIFCPSSYTRKWTEMLLTLCNHHGLWLWFLYMLLWPSYIQFHAKKNFYFLATVFRLTSWPLFLVRTTTETQGDNLWLLKQQEESRTYAYSVPNSIFSDVWTAEVHRRGVDRTLAAKCNRSRRSEARTWHIDGFQLREV